MNKIEELECFFFATFYIFRCVLDIFSEIPYMNTHLIQNTTPGRSLVGDVLRKIYSENIEQSYRRTLTPKCDLNKTAKPLYSNHDSA